MTEAIWEPAKYEDIKAGDTVRVTRKDGPQTTITEGKVTVLSRLSNGEAYWDVADYENFYAYEFAEKEEGEVSTLERLKPAFSWPTKLGAVITADNDGEAVTAVLVELDTDDPEWALWWTTQWGSVNKADLEGLTDLTVVSEGVTVGA